MIEIKHMNKTFRSKTGNVDALQDVSLTIRDGEIYGVIGYSGAGKSTLVRCINLLETPDNGSLKIGGSGEIVIRDGIPTIGGKKMTEKSLNAMRKGIGMIFQHFNLLDRSTVFENIAYPLRGKSMAEKKERVMELLRLVDLEEKVNAYPSQLSGGQKQRVAIARALANNPSVLLSDEATSALDPDATESILNLLTKLNRELGLTIVLITHEMAVIKAVCHRVAVMNGGAVVEEGSVYDVFASPFEKITRKFVNSSTALGKLDKMMMEKSAMLHLEPGQQLIRLSFRQDSVSDAVISQVSRRFDVDLNIVLANVEVLESRPLGGMVAVISGMEVAKALQYLKECNVEVEVIDDGTGA